MQAEKKAQRYCSILFITVVVSFVNLTQKVVDNISGIHIGPVSHWIEAILSMLTLTLWGHTLDRFILINQVHMLQRFVLL